MILVTGGTGLIGGFIIRELVMRGHKVKVLRRQSSDIELINDLQHQITFVEGDLLDIPSLSEAVQDVE